jgi:hypothetical protein
MSEGKAIISILCGLLSNLHYCKNEQIEYVQRHGYCLRCCERMGECTCERENDDESESETSASVIIVSESDGE